MEDYVLLFILRRFGEFLPQIYGVLLSMKE